MALIGRSVPREYYSIGEVCELLDLKPHVLRYWETQFPELDPSKNRAGNRVYRRDDIELIALIRQLVHEERYTVEGARRRIELMRAGRGGLREESRRALEASQLETIGRELREVLALLTPDPS